MYIEGWTVEDVTRNLVERHEVTQPGKVDRIVASLLANGWQGRPLLATADNYALTGTHRIAALRQLMEEYYEFDEAQRDKIDELTVPVVVIESDVPHHDCQDDDELLAALIELGEADAAEVLRAEIEANLDE